MSAVARFTANGDLQLAGKLFAQWPALDDTEQVDEVLALDDLHQVDDQGEVDSLLSYLMALTVQQRAVDFVRLDHHGNLLAPAVLTMTGTTWQVRSTRELAIPGVLVENKSF